MTGSATSAKPGKNRGMKEVHSTGLLGQVNLYRPRRDVAAKRISKPLILGCKEQQVEALLTGCRKRPGAKLGRQCLGGL